MPDIAPSAPTSPGGAPSPAPAKAPAASGAPSSPAPSSTPNKPVAPNAPNPTGASKQIEGATETKTPEPKAEEPWKKKLKLKVDGKEIEEEYDEHRLQVELQKARAADKRFQEAAETRKKIEAALAEGKKDPARAMKELFGLDPREWAQSLLAEQLNEELLTPEEKQRKELKRKVAEYENRDKEAKAKADAEAKAAFEKQVWEESEKEALEALDELGYEDKAFQRNTLLPMLAEKAIVNLEKGIDLTPKQLAGLVKKDLQTVHQKEIRGVKGQKLLDYLGPEVVREVLIARRDIMRGASAEPAKPKVEEAPQEQRQPVGMSKFWKRNLS